MKGFAQAALAHSEDAAIRDRALVMIDRQAMRLARLTQDLLWTVRAQSGKFPSGRRLSISRSSPDG